MENQNNFRDPVFQQLAAINGKINLMSRHELVVQLSQFHLDNKGTTDVLKKRLKYHYKQKKMKKAGLLDRIHRTHFDCLCVIDFEATCETINAGYKHEIIEFPAVLVNVRSQEIIDTFHSFCRPVLNPTLSFFCMELTGIEQEQVSKAKTFPEVLKDFESWMEKHMLGKMFNYAIVTDGPWDMAKFLSLQCQLSRVQFPNFGKKWINISKTYSNFYKTKRLPLAAMLKNSGLEFEGKPHSGLDDTYNIARIVLRMLKDGAPLKINEHIHNNSLTTGNQHPSANNRNLQKTRNQRPPTNGSNIQTTINQCLPTNGFNLQIPRNQPLPTNRYSLQTTINQCLPTDGCDLPTTRNQSPPDLHKPRREFIFKELTKSLGLDPEMAEPVYLMSRCQLGKCDYS